MEWVALLLFLTVIVVLLVFMRESRFHREYNARESMDDEKFYQSFYATTQIHADIPLRLRPIYARFWGIDPLKLRPLDCPPEIVDIDTVELVQEIEREYDVSISDDDAEKIDGSFDSIVQLSCRSSGRPTMNAR